MGRCAPVRPAGTMGVWHRGKPDHIDYEFYCILSGQHYAQAVGHSQRREGRARLGRTGGHIEIRGGAVPWGPARHFAKHPGDLERRGLNRPYGKPRCRPRMSQTDSAVPHERIGRVAGGAAIYGANMADSAGFRRIQTPGMAQHQVRRDQREAVRKTARRAPCMAWLRCGGHAGQGKRLAVFERDTGQDAARIRPYAGQRPILRSRKLPGRKGQWTPPYNRVQFQLYNRGRRRRGGDVEVS